MTKGPVGEVRVRRWDVVAVLWVAVWMLAGVATWYELWQLTALATSVSDSGAALTTAGRALQDLSGTPFIGARIGELGDQVSTTATGVIRSGEAADDSIRRLSVLIGLAVGLGPAGPVLVAYLPLRRQWASRRRAPVTGERHEGTEAQ